jgi:hypothetical protein
VTEKMAEPLVSSHSRALTAKVGLEVVTAIRARIEKIGIRGTLATRFVIKSLHELPDPDRSERHGCGSTSGGRARRMCWAS